MKLKKELVKPLLLLHAIMLLYSLGGIFSKFAAKEALLSIKFILLYGGLLFILQLL